MYIHTFIYVYYTYTYIKELCQQVFIYKEEELVAAKPIWWWLGGQIVFMITYVLCPSWFCKIAALLYIYVNLPALSECYPHFRHLTRNENTVRFHLHSFLVTRFNTLNHCLQNTKVYFLSKSTDTLLNFENNLAINVLYKSLNNALTTCKYVS